MADENNEEKLRITAELDTSKLKQEARTGLQSVSNEAQKVENQFKRTSTSIDGVGKSVAKASQQSTHALKQIGNEAEKTAKKIASIDTSVQNLKLGQAIGFANQFANSSLGKSIGGAIGNGLGMSETAQGMAGSVLGGALGGAQMGAMVGGVPGAVVGGLAGAASSLLTAGIELQKAAQKQIDKLKQEQGDWIDQKAKNAFINGLEGKTDADLRETLSREKQKQANLNRQMDELANASGVVASHEYTYIPGKGQVITDSGINSSATLEKSRQISEAIAQNTKDRENTLERIALLEAEIAKRAKNQTSQIETDNDRMTWFNDFSATAANDYFNGVKKMHEEIQASKKTQLDTLSKQENGISSLLGNIKGDYKLSDALTRVGGGGGYGAQMSGVASNVTTIKNTLNSILTEIKLQKTQVTSGIFTD